MILVDANILLYAYDSSSDHHAEARAWLEETLSGNEEVRFAITVLLAFVRISTSPALQRPLKVEEAIGFVRSWLEQPIAGIADPTSRHWTTLEDLARSGQARGPLVMDAHLAALATELGATLYTADRDFARFPALRFTNPLEG